MLSQNSTRLINKIAKVPRSKHSLSIYLMHKIAQKIYKEMWLTRCKEQYNNLSKQNISQITDDKTDMLTVSTAIADTHNTKLTESKIKIKLKIWEKMFINHNTSPNHINTIID